MKSYPLVDLRQEYLSQKKEIDMAIARILNKASFFLGEELEKFEKEFARFIGTKHALGVASGTASIKLSLQALGIGRGDEVITTPLTFIATAEAIIAVGAKPVFVDVDGETLNIDPNKIGKAISNETKAIIPVHLYGIPCDIDPILAIAKKNKLYVIEDCAQAHGSTYKGKKVGSFGDTGCFSFYAAKLLGAYGDAGAITTSNKELYKKISLLRNHGRSAANKNLHLVIGNTSVLDSLQAAILAVKLRRIKENIKKRLSRALYYNKLLSGTEVEPMILPSGTLPSLYVYVIRVKKRAALKNYLAKKKISAGIHFPISLHLQPSLKSLGYKKGDFPFSEKAAKEVLSLPLHQFLTKRDQEYIVSKLTYAANLNK